MSRAPILTIEQSEFDLFIDSKDTSVPGGIATLNQVTLAGGKKFRPRLLMSMAECLSVDSGKAAPYAVAAERVHNATLLHDDVIDEAQIRRGKATLNANGENKKAILAGDLLLVRTLRELGMSEQRLILQDLFDVLVELTEGEWLQLEARGKLEVGERHLREVARKKTGSLIGWCCSTPSRLRNDDSVTVQALREFGVQLGVSFQIADDCLDFDKSSGKPFSQDLVEGQVNFVIEDLLSHAPGLRSEIQSHLRQNHKIPFTSEFQKNLGPALERTLRKARVELDSAQFALSGMGIESSQLVKIKKEIVDPFLIELEKMKWRLIK